MITAPFSVDKKVHIVFICTAYSRSGPQFDDFIISCGLLFIWFSSVFEFVWYLQLFLSCIYVSLVFQLILPLDVIFRSKRRNDFLVTDQHQHSKYIVICEFSCWLSVPSDCPHSVQCLFQYSVKHGHDACTVSDVFLVVLNMHMMPIRCLVFVSVQC